VLAKTIFVAFVHKHVKIQIDTDITFHGYYVFTNNDHGVFQTLVSLSLYDV
jgi:hypothetical protein